MAGNALLFRCDNGGKLMIGLSEDGRLEIEFRRQDGTTDVISRLPIEAVKSLYGYLGALIDAASPPPVITDYAKESK